MKHVTVTIEFNLEEESLLNEECKEFISEVESGKFEKLLFDKNKIGAINGKVNLEIK